MIKVRGGLAGFGSALIQGLVCPCKKREIWTEAQREDGYVMTETEDGVM